MTVTRLRSEKGSFVQSPLGAFESESEAFSGVVEFVLDTPAQTWIWTAPCTWSEFASSAPGYDQTWFKFPDPGAGPLTPAQAVNLTYVGATSGAQYRPADHLLGVKCSVGASPNRLEWWEGNDATPIGGAFAYGNAVQFQNINDAAPALLRMVLYVDYGEWPTAARPAFQQGESFTAS